MQVKTYTGSGAPEVLALIKAELGADAVILSSRDITRNGKKMVEITAGVERQENAAASVPPGWNEWHQEWSRLKDHIYALMQPAIDWEKLSPRQRVALDYLEKEGVEADVLIELYQALLKDSSGSSMLSALAKIVPVRQYSRTNWPQKIQIMAGPYGSGKTTTALRLGMNLRRNRPDLSIAYLNTDCARGNGRLVLRHWTELSDFIYHETPDASSMANALRACKDADVIFIDLPGLARGESLTDKLAGLGLGNAQESSSVAMHVTLPPHYSSSQIASILNRYQIHLPTSLIWTKLDEAASFGQLVNVAARSNVPVSALSFGPELQASLAPAEEGLIWRLLLKRQLPVVSENGKAA